MVVPISTTIYLSFDYFYLIDSYEDLIVTYTATDFAGNKREQRCSLSVIDRISPMVDIPEVSESIKLGKTLTVPKIVYTDNSGSECVVSTYIVKPSGDKKWLKEGVYTFDEKGEYKLRFCVFDNDGNSTCVEFIVVSN